MNDQSLFRLRLASAAGILLLTVLACNLPMKDAGGGLPVEGDAPPAVEISPLPEQPVATEGVPSARITGLEAGTTLVWWLSTYNLVIDQPGGDLQPLDLQVPITSDLGMPAEMGAFRQTDAGLGITLLGKASAGMPEFQPGIILIGSGGAAQKVNAPASTGTLVGAAWSPDGARIAWLFDVTVVVPNPFDPEACTEAAGCVGRVYDLVLTNPVGGNGETILLNHIVKRTNFPHLQFDRWRGDSAALFLKINSHIPSAYYEDQGGAILQVDVPSGTLAELDDAYLSTNTFVSSDGRWLAWNNDIDTQTAIRIVGPGGVECKTPFTAAQSRPLAYTLAFSPDSTQLAWLDVTPPEDSAASRLETAAVRIMKLEGCEQPRMLVELEQPLFIDDLPHLTGWLNDTLLMVSTHHDTRVLDTAAGSWVEFEWPLLADPATLAGAVWP